MMFERIISEIFNNVSLITALIAMVLAQLLKIIYYLITDKKLIWRHFFGVGGMPSSHSALVSCLSMMVGLLQGFDSIFFSIAAILSFIIMYDAIKVRPEEVAHTLIEVSTGMIFGIIVAIISFNLFI